MTPLIGVEDGFSGPLRRVFYVRQCSLTGLGVKPDPANVDVLQLVPGYATPRP